MILRYRWTFAVVALITFVYARYTRTLHTRFWLRWSPVDCGWLFTYVVTRTVGLRCHCALITFCVHTLRYVVDYVVVVVTRYVTHVGRYVDGYALLRFYVYLIARYVLVTLFVVERVCVYDYVGYVVTLQLRFTVRCVTNCALLRTRVALRVALR